MRSDRGPRASRRRRSAPGVGPRGKHIEIGVHVEQRVEQRDRRLRHARHHPRNENARCRLRVSIPSGPTTLNLSPAARKCCRVVTQALEELGRVVPRSASDTIRSYGHH